MAGNSDRKLVVLHQSGTEVSKRPWFQIDFVMCIVLFIYLCMHAKTCHHREPPLVSQKGDMFDVVVMVNFGLGNIFAHI